MEINDIFNLLHNAVEAQHNGKKISQKTMSEKLDISMRTYQDWRLGNAKPQAAKAVLEKGRERPSMSDQQSLRSPA